MTKNMTGNKEDTKRVRNGTVSIGIGKTRYGTMYTFFISEYQTPYTVYEERIFFLGQTIPNNVFGLS